MTTYAWEKCPDCRKAKAAHWMGVTGWFIDSVGTRHNHPKTRPTSASARAASDDLELTAEEEWAAQQLGLSREAVLVQKYKDASEELRGRVAALELEEQFTQGGTRS